MIPDLAVVKGWLAMFAVIGHGLAAPRSLTFLIGAVAGALALLLVQTHVRVIDRIEARHRAEKAAQTAERDPDLPP